MKRKQLIFSLLISLFALTNSFAQVTLVCNDMVYVTLGQNCTHVVEKEEILEGSFCTSCDYAVEIDKTPPYGDGPWVPAILDSSDIGKSYAVRVKELSSGNICWGTIKVVERLACTDVTIVNLNAGNPTVLLSEDLQINFKSNCLPIDSATVTVNGGQTSITYDCADLGVHVLQVAASYQSSFTDSCHTTVVVDDPLSECSSCITCPAAATVSFEQGGSVLLPAYHSGDWTTFDIYGDANYNSACTFEDSTYTVEYHTSAFGQNWYIRRWEGKDAAGQVTATCEQVIVFPFFHNITINGKVFIDSIQDCTYNVGEQGVGIFEVIATILPSNQQTVVTPASDGFYSFYLPINGLDSIVRIQQVLPAGFSTSCPTTLEIPATTTTQQHTFDIGLQAAVFCPLMDVSMGSVLIRRCVNNSFYVEYCNYGYITAEDAYITIAFDPLYQIESSTLPWSGVDGNNYTFDLGDVPPLSCGTFQIVALLNCDATLGQTICNDVTIYPHEPCGGLAWDGPFIETVAYCNGDTVSLAVWNTGNQPMTEELQYIVIEDVIMYRQDNFLLGAGDSITVKMPANGSTWRIEAGQVAGYPLPDEPSAAVESCGGLNTPGLINAFPANDAMAYYDRVCETVVASCDPNDKNAVPTGYGAFNTIRANTDLEYKIRFQNTGTDTAFRVVIMDTLSALLNPATIEAGASSHSYRLDVFPGGILHFVFDPIVLPDSNVNEVASHGYVIFRIAQQPDLPDGTVITNSAAIYFDFNDAVITNTAWHTIGEPFVTVETIEPALPGVAVESRPNPFHDRTAIQMSGVEIKEGLFTLFDTYGRVVLTQPFQGNQFDIERRNLSQGMYFFQISAGGMPVAHGKLQVY